MSTVYKPKDAEDFLRRLRVGTEYQLDDTEDQYTVTKIDFENKKYEVEHIDIPINSTIRFEDIIMSWKINRRTLLENYNRLEVYCI